MKCSSYIFDFDGTLVDSMPYWSQKILNVLEETKTEYPSDIIKIVATLGDKGAAQYLKDELKVPLSVSEMLKKFDEYALDKYRDIILLKEGVFEYLTMLKERNCSLNILTASPHKMLDPCLKRNGIYDLFDNVWSCDDFKMIKAEPQIYKEAVKKIGVKESETAFFDDNAGAIKAASQAGLCTVGVYDKSGEDFTSQIKAIADLYVDAFTGLEQIEI